MKFTLVAAAAFAAAVVATPAAADMTKTGEVAIQTAGRIMFEHRCRVCHSESAAVKTYGPTLVGVVGRKAGSVEGFQYSDAMKKSGIVWTDEALRAWMANNDGLMPGTKMRHVGVTDAAEQDFILAYLKSLKK